MRPPLNWKEIEWIVRNAEPLLRGARFDRIQVGNAKNVFHLRFDRASLLLSLRPQNTYFTVSTEKKPASSPGAPTATRSPFDLAVHKQLKDLRVIAFIALPKERAILIWFDTKPRRGLAIVLIPAQPAAYLIEEPLSTKGYRVLAKNKGNTEDTGHFLPPDGSRSPADPPVRSEWFVSNESWDRVVRDHMEKESRDAKALELERARAARVAALRKKSADAEAAIIRARAEKDWKKFADLLKSELYQKPTPVQGVYLLETEEGTIEIPADPACSNAAQQVEKYYSLAKRKARRESEALERRNEAEEELARLESTKTPEALAQILGLRSGNTKVAPPKLAARSKEWSGKKFISKDGTPIWVGRSREENLELTFKIARGNDMWFHVKGKPGAHAVAFLNPGKSASLETLLDAAHLVLYYSGGERWGKSEVDYTFKKYVKRIRDSSEASYTQNKSLWVDLDRGRIARLTGTPTGD